MRIDYLHEFVMLAETMSYTEAAKKLYVTQPTLSKHMAAVEKELGADLFSRNATGMTLTSIGMVFYEDARIVLNTYNNALIHVEAEKTQRESVLRIGYLRDASLQYLRPISTWFAKHHPAMDLQFRSIEYKSLAPALRDGNVDAVMTMDNNPELHELCNSFPLYQDTFVVALPLNHKLSKNETVTLEDLRSETLLVPSGEIWPQIRDFIERNCIPESVALVKQMDDVDTLFYMVETAQGIAVVTSHNELEYGNRIAFRKLDDIEAPCFPVSAMWLKESEANPIVCKGIRLLEQALTSAKESMANKKL